MRYHFLELLHRWKNWLTGLFISSRLEEELNIEMEHHLQNSREQFEREGIPTNEARKQALKGFGNVEGLKEDCRDSWGVRLISDFFTDLRMGWRQAITNRRYSFIIILTLGLCIGVNTAIFSMLNNYLFTRYPDYPYPDSDTLVRVISDTHYKGKIVNTDNLSLSVYEDILHAESLEEIGYYRNGVADVLLDGSVHDKPSLQVSPSFFRVLGVQPLMGRWFEEEEKTEGRHRVVMLSYAFWQSSFGGDPGVLGKIVEIDGENFEVVGVMPEGFYFAYRTTSLWRPMVFQKFETASRRNKTSVSLLSIARLNPQVSRSEAQAELNAIVSNTDEYAPMDESDVSFRVSGVRLENYYYENGGGHPKQGILILQGSALLILLIGCLNIANLLLARLNARSQEVALRVMLGARVGRIARMLLTESFLYGMAGCVLGLCLGFLSIEVIKYFDFNIVHLRGPLQMDRAVFLYTVAIALTCSIAIGIFPLFSALRLRLNSGSHDSRRSTSTGKGDQRLRGLLIITQVSMSCVLLITTGLLIKSMGNLLKVDPGFDPDQTLVVNQIRGSPQLNHQQRLQYYSGLLERVQNTPGVLAAGTNGSHPFSGNSMWNSFYSENQDEPLSNHEINSVNGNYFEAVGQKLLEGRTFNKFDFEKDSERVAIVDQSFSSKYFPHEKTVGKRIRQDLDTEKPYWITIVGVVEDVVQNSLAENREEHKGQIYLPDGTVSFYSMSIIVRYGGGEGVNQSISKGLMTKRLLSVIREYNPMKPPPHIQGYEDIINDSLKQRRVLISLLVAFAGLALLLSSIGLYGAISYAVQQRRKEIGIRLAIGAPHNSIAQLIVKSGMKLTFVGLTIGLIGTIIVSHLIRSQLFQVKTLDGAVYVLAGVLIVTISFFASYLPSRRALNTDPIASLRGD